MIRERERHRTSVEVRLLDDDGTDTLSLDEEAADGLVRPTSIELLRAVAREEPSSIREAARLVDRDVRQVHDGLRSLGRMGLVEFDRGGRSHRPIVGFEQVEVRIDVRSPEGKVRQSAGVGSTRDVPAVAASRRS